MKTMYMTTRLCAFLDSFDLVAMVEQRIEYRISTHVMVTSAN